MSISIPSAFVAHPAGTSPAFINASPAPDGRATEQCGDSPAALPVEPLLTGSEAPKVPEFSNEDLVVKTCCSALNLIESNRDHSCCVENCLKPIATVAREHPGVATTLRVLAYTWLRGAYWAKPCTGLIGWCGSSFDAEFDELWNRLVRTDSDPQQLSLEALWSGAAATGLRTSTSAPFDIEQQERELTEMRLAFLASNVEAMLQLMRDGDVDAPLQSHYVGLLADVYDHCEDMYSCVKSQIQEVNPTISPTALDEAVMASFTEEEAA